MDDLEAAMAMDDESDRANAVQRFIEAAPPDFRFPDDLLPRLLALDPGRGTRTAVIAAAVRRLAPEQLERALPHITGQSNEKVWVWDLGAVMPWLPPSALSQALEIAEKIKYEAARGYALEAIVPALPRELQQRAIESALQLQSVAGRVTTVASMLERAPAAATDDALEAIVSSLPEIESVESRARCTAEVVTALARSGRPDRAQVLLVEADELLARIPPDSDPSFFAIFLHQARGDVLEAQSEHDGAITAYQEALATVERTQQSHLAPALLLRLGKSYKGANQLDEATATLSRAVESDPGFYLELETRRELWQVHRRAGRWAVAALEERRVRAMGREVGARPEFDLSRTLTPDLPSAKDELGFEPLADALADMLNDPKTRLPLTIALTAPWGGGKSSLMQQLEQRLRSGGGRASTRGAARRWFTIRFDAWKFHQSEQIWASLAKEIYRQAQRDFSLLQKLAFRARLEWSRGTLQTDLLLAGVIVAASVVAGVLLASLKGGLAEKAALVGAATGLAGTAAIMFARHGRDLANPFRRAVDRHQARQQAYRAALGVTAEAAADVDALTESLTRHASSAIAVLVDDLDRCQLRPRRRRGGDDQSDLQHARRPSLRVRPGHRPRCDRGEPRARVRGRGEVPRPPQPRAGPSLRRELPRKDRADHRRHPRAEPGRTEPAPEQHHGQRSARAVCRR